MKKVFLLILIIMGVFSMSFSQDNLGDKALKFVSTYDGTEQPYRFFIPDTYDKKSEFPLLVVLHGKWVDQNAWFDFTPVKKYADKFGYFVAAPLGRGDYFYRGAAERDVLDMIDQIKKEYKVDSTRVYLMGHSMGGWGTWWLGLRNPDQFATICPMAGMPPSDWLMNAMNLDPYIIHSDDDPIVPVANSRIPAAALSEMGISYRYKEERDYGHASAMIGDNFPVLFDWLEKHKINKSPKYIKFATRSPLKGKAYWQTIVETIEFPKYANADAKVLMDKEKNTQTLAVKTSNVKRIMFDVRDIPVDHTKPLAVQIDGAEFQVDGNSPKIIYCRDGADAKWREPKNEEETITDYKSPQITEIPKDAAELKDVKLMSSAACGKLLEILKDNGVDVLLMRHDMFMTPGGNLTADDIIDLYVGPVDRLGIVEYKGEELPTYLNEKPMFFPTGIYNEEDLKSGKVKSYKVAAPIDILERMNMKYEPLPDTIGEYLYKSVSKNGKFIK